MNKIKYILLLILIICSNPAFASKIIKINIDGGIGPATVEYLQSGIEKAEKEKAGVLIIQMNTPGGLLEATRTIVKDILASKVPIVVYIAPGGSRAGSAGVFITLAANIAIMAPGTNIGAAHPVTIGGGSDTNSVMTEKITNDASAFIRSIAQKRKRNVKWAELTVRKSISATENEALANGAIDFICPDLDSVLKAINGMNVEIENNSVQINTNNPQVIDYEQSWRMKLLALISNPNIAYIFMLIGIYGIILELYHPGAIFPGVVGGISIILAGYSMQMLPINYAGLALIILAIILFIVEIKVTSYGLLTIGGIISFLLGSIMLIKNESEFEFVRISMTLIITAAIFTALFFIAIAVIGIKAQSKKITSGKEAMIGEIGKAITTFDDKKGDVKVHGEIWKAYSDENISKDDEVKIIGFDKFELKVKRK